MTSRTQVGIVGAGPAGLMLGQLLHLQGIDSVILENRTRQHVIERVRAGVLEQGTVDLMRDVGVGGRLSREGMRHDGIYLAFGGTRHRIDMASLTGGRAITIYGQNEVVHDLIEARLETGRPLHFEVEDVSVHDLESETPQIRFRHNGTKGTAQQLTCDVIAGCDGFHGICRPSIPASRLRLYERIYPFGWLGILAEAAPSSNELVYSLHERGFALFSMRSQHVTRLYLQCAPDEDVSAWSDARIWAELATRLSTDDGWRPNEGAILQKGVTGMRSFVAEPMRFGRLFLAGDAAHIVPPTGAKGPQSGDGRRLSTRRRARRILRVWPLGAPRRLFRTGPGAHLARAAVLLVDDVDAAPVRQRQPVRPPAPTGGTGVSCQFARGHDEPRRELHRGTFDA